MTEETIELEFICYGTNDGPFYYEINGLETDFADFKKKLSMARQAAPDSVKSKRIQQIPPEVLLRWREEGRSEIFDMGINKREKQAREAKANLSQLMSELDTLKKQQSVVKDEEPAAPQPAPKPTRSTRKNA